jgi:predicted negative regulator of RcsB-dependent stress response
MAEIYTSDKEQVEALQRWWKENGKTIIAGLVIGLGGVFGWTSWQKYQTSRAEAASALYQAQSDALAGGRNQESEQLGSRILEEFAGSGYAGMSALLLAKSAFDRGEPDEARRYLQWVLGSDARRELVLTARLRLAPMAARPRSASACCWKCSSRYCWHRSGCCFTPASSPLPFSAGRCNGTHHNVTMT